MRDRDGRRRYDNVLQTIGWTPLIRLNRVVDGARTPVWIKVESFNPGGSVKDRIGLAIIEAAEREGRLRPGGTVVEGTSGNTGVGLAIAAAVKGYRCIFTIPDKMSAEKVRLLKAFGAEVIVTPSAVGPSDPDYYGNVARRIAEETPGAILADQFFNPVNPQAHYETTGPEIWEQTEGRVTHFVAAPGTGGTISGAARYLKERNPEILVIAGDPEGSIFAGYARTGEKGTGAPYKVEGIGNDKIPDTLHFDVVDEFRTVSDRTAFLMARRLTREEGLLAGGSTGLIVKLAVDVAREADDPNACVVCLLCDTGERYLSKLYNDEWMRENRMLVVEPASARALLTVKQAAGGPALVEVGAEATVAEALDLLDRHGVSQLPVLEEGRAVGSVTETALMSAALEDPACLERPVSTVAQEVFPVVEANEDVSRISRLFTRKVPAVLVQEEDRIVGIVTPYDILHHMIGT
ncbi:MAG: pyridoxal-phosphate dependent enzyme [Gemmatimonadota bacterium]